ncbi:MAG: hypothetical protein OXF98_10235 [Rhodospirillaceae bacterium]|nr:hypothetical protein [Rhodospirillaceae bacterium]
MGRFSVLSRHTADLDGSYAAMGAVRPAPVFALVSVAVRVGTDTGIVIRAAARAEHGSGGPVHFAWLDCRAMCGCR